MRLELRGIGPAIIRRYLTEIGSQETEGGTLVGDGWAASVEAGEPVPIGGFRIALTVVTLAGDSDTLAGVVEALKAKALRAGG